MLLIGTLISISLFSFLRKKTYLGKKFILNYGQGLKILNARFVIRSLQVHNTTYVLIILRNPNFCLDQIMESKIIKFLNSN